MVEFIAEPGYRELIVLRHAKTEQVASSDRARRLTDRGRGDAAAAGRFLRDEGLTPAVVLTSPAARAKATAEIVCAQLGDAPQPQIVEDLYGADGYDVLAVLAEVDPDASPVLVVGHNPTMEGLAFALQADVEDEWAPHLPTAGIAVLRIPAPWRDVQFRSGRLTRWHVPRI